MRTLKEVLAATSMPGRPLPAPEYRDRGHVDRNAFMVASMQRHMTDEGYQLALALQAGGYALHGFGFDGLTDCSRVGGTVVLQDKREWLGRTAGAGFDVREQFVNVKSLRDKADVFKLTVLKDAHSDAALHIEAANEAGVHGWIVYYHPAVVAAQSPFVRREHLVRTYHSVDPLVVPPFRVRSGAGILSGALSRAYPLRSRLAISSLRNVDCYKHPGYGRHVCHTPKYLDMLSAYRVAVCTSSRFGYAVRKIVEATACGCVIVTDLPVEDVLPEIDGNLARVRSEATPMYIDQLVGDLAASWDAERQRMWAERALRFYDYNALGRKLASDIEQLRRQYNG